MGLDFNDFGGVSEPKNSPQLIDLKLIDEDPDQPRKTFDQMQLEGLASSIRERGVKSPISLREGDSGRYIINFGARRFRASQLAGKTHIPAFIDNDFVREDQLIENIQREDLKMMDIARYIKFALDHYGISAAKLADKIGKSKAWVSNYLNILNLEPRIEKLLDDNLITDYLLANDINRFYKKDPEAAERFLAEHDDKEPIFRSELKKFQKDFQNNDNFISDAKENVDDKDSFHEEMETNEDSDKSNQTPEIDDDFSGFSSIDELPPSPETEDDEEVEHFPCNPDEKWDWGDEDDSPKSKPTKSPTPKEEEISVPEDDMQSLDDLDKSDFSSGSVSGSENDPEPEQDQMSVAEIRCTCSLYGEVSIVFRPASSAGKILISADGEIHEIEPEELRITKINFE